MDKSVDEMAKLVGAISNPGVNLPAYAEIYPNGEAPVLTRDASGDGGLTLERMTFGLPPPGHQAGEKISRPIGNVRNLQSNFWKSMLSAPERRCLVPVSRFCEWTGEKGAKRKVWFGLKDEPLFCFAGIWRAAGQQGEGMQAEGGDLFGDSQPAARMAFLTTDPNSIVRPIHAKSMPVILRREEYECVAGRGLWRGDGAGEALSRWRHGDCGGVGKYYSICPSLFMQRRRLSQASKARSTDHFCSTNSPSMKLYSGPIDRPDSGLGIRPSFRCLNRLRRAALSNDCFGSATDSGSLGM